MSFPFYVNPEQMTQDKAEFARKGIARGKSIVTLEYDLGILLLAENPFKLSKIGEIYDRIAFAGVGKFSEFDRLRKMGVQWADVEGYRFSRDDVRGKALAAMQDRIAGDQTVVFVSHMADQIKKLCTRVVWLKDGRVEMEGDPEEVVDSYQQFINDGHRKGRESQLAEQAGRDTEKTD